MLRVAFRALACAGLLASAVAASAAGVDYGAPGEPVHLVVGHPPYASAHWSALVVRGLALHERHLPPGSTVRFHATLDGNRVADALRAGAQHIGYLGAETAARAASHSDADEVRLVATTALGRDQCSVLLVRPGAPKTTEAAWRWLDGRDVAVQHATCTERFVRALATARGFEPARLLDQNIEVVTAEFRAGRLDAAAVPEPAASRLVAEGVARRIATGASTAQVDAAFLAMRGDLVRQRPDVVAAWLRAELEAQRILADPRRAPEVLRLVSARMPRFHPGQLWSALYGAGPALEDGRPRTLAWPFVLDGQARQALRTAREFLQATGRAAPGALRPTAIAPGYARRVRAERPVPRPARVRWAPPPAGLAQRTAPGKLSIRVARHGWDADPRRIETVLQAAAQALLPRFPGRPLAPIVVSHSTITPLSLYEPGPGGEYRIELTASGLQAEGYVYEFAHEFCHVLANYEQHPHHAASRRHQWFEEALCEAASLYVLRALARTWEGDPDAQLAAAAPRMRAFADRFYGEAHRRLPSGMTLASWYPQASERLADTAYDRGRNEVVANLLLPLFEQNPALWEAIGFLNLDYPGETFRDYLQNWHDNAPARHREAIRTVTALFFSMRPPAGVSAVVHASSFSTGQD